VETVALFCLNLLIVLFIDFNLPPTDFSHPPTAFLLPIPGRDVYFLSTANLKNYPPTGHEHKYHPGSTYGLLLYSPQPGKVADLFEPPQDMNSHFLSKKITNIFINTQKCAVH